MIKSWLVSLTASSPFHFFSSPMTYLHDLRLTDRLLSQWTYLLEGLSVLTWGLNDMLVSSFDRFVYTLHTPSFHECFVTSILKSFETWKRSRGRTNVNPNERIPFH